MRRSVLVLAITGVACSAQQPPLADGSIDAAAPIDGSSIDAPTPIDVTTATTDGGALTAECSYCWMGYGQTCDVPCSSATDVMFDLRLTWSGCGYCCTVGDHDQYWRGCHCESGHAVCPDRRGLPGSYALPWSACEFCGDMGTPIDASTSGG